jgi:ABC-type oligopeptide transport system ATPase subunit
MTSTSDAPPADVEPLLRLRGVERRYPIKSGALQRVIGQVQAVDGVDLDIYEGEAVGLVGESGSGKSTLGRVLLRLEPTNAGTIHFDGRDITELSMHELRSRRSEMQLIFQDPFSSLDPRTTVAESIMEGLRAQGVGKKERRQRLDEVLDLVGLEKYHARRFPHEFSGGQRQRIGIARALALHPKLIIADEPVSALDVSIQAQIVNLLQDLQDEFGFSYVFVAHDIGVVRHVSDRIAVMHDGKIVEEGSADQVCDSPRDPYTKSLLSAVPITDPRESRARRRL